MSDLPFELRKDHKSTTKNCWKRNGLIMDNFEEIYNKYIYATHCQLCNKQFEKSLDRQMEHNHETGEFRNIVCNKCNHKKADVKLQSNNTSGYKGICKAKNKRLKQGFTWIFKVRINGKQKTIKHSKDFDKLVEFADKWKKDNNYHSSPFVFLYVSKSDIPNAPMEATFLSPLNTSSFFPLLLLGFIVTPIAFALFLWFAFI